VELIVMQLVMRGGTQYNNHLLCNLCRWGWFMQWNSCCPHVESKVSPM